MGDEGLAGSLEGISESAIFAQLFHPAMVTDPNADALPLFQLGAAIMLDKPLLVIVLQDREDALPEKLRRFADKVVVVPDMGPRGAALIQQAMRELGL